MLTKEQKNALKTMMEISAEIDMPNTIETLRWAAGNLADEAKILNKEDADLIIDQIQTLVSCMSWVCQIYSCSEELERAERDLNTGRGACNATS